MKAGAERLAIPPGEDLCKKFLHDLSRSIIATGKVTAGFSTLMALSKDQGKGQVAAVTRV
ncbi:hypothetical protein D9M68_936160 [compost metagenome]